MIILKPIKRSYMDGFELVGHAEYAESGADIVCSAVSSAVLMLNTILENFRDRGFMKMKVEQKKGYVKMVFDEYDDDDAWLDISNIIMPFVWHISDIAEKYSENVRVDYYD